MVNWDVLQCSSDAHWNRYIWFAYNHVTVLFFVEPSKEAKQAESRQKKNFKNKCKCVRLLKDASVKCGNIKYL